MNCVARLPQVSSIAAHIRIPGNWGVGQEGISKDFVLAGSVSRELHTQDLVVSYKGNWAAGERLKG